MTADNLLTMEKFNELLQPLYVRLEELDHKISRLSTHDQVKLATEMRLRNLERGVDSLKKPVLMYRPPKSEEHETIVDTLDRLHKDIDELKEWHLSQDQQQ